MVYPEGRSSLRMEKLIEGIQDCGKAGILSEEWKASGNTEKLSALDSALALFNFETLTAEGASAAVRSAKAVLAE